MLKKTITYTDFNGESRTEDFFFHLSKADLVELQMSHKGGLADWLQRIIDSDNQKAIIDEFKNLILLAYGKKSSSGRNFIKNESVREDFVSTEAYSILFMELVTDPDAAAAFVNGIVPAGLEEDMRRLQDNVQERDTIDPASTPRVLTRTEIIEMDHDELTGLIATGQAVIGD